MVSRSYSRRVTAAGHAVSMDAPTGGPAPSISTFHFVPLPRFVWPTLPPLVDGHEPAVGNMLLPAQVCWSGNWAKKACQRLRSPRLLPVVEPPPPDPGAPISLRQLTPLRPGPELPEDALNTAPIFNAWTPPPRNDAGEAGRWMQSASQWA
jgi:hypothetical protein